MREFVKVTIEFRQRAGSDFYHQKATSIRKISKDDSNYEQSVAYCIDDVMQSAIQPNEYTSVGEVYRIISKDLLPSEVVPCPDEGAADDAD